MSKTTSTQGEYTRDPHDRDPYRRKVQQTSSDHTERKRPRIPPQQRRFIPVERMPIVIMSGLWTLIGVFLAGFMFHHLAFLVIVTGVTVFLVLVLYPPRCPRCRGYIFRGIHVCGDQQTTTEHDTGKITLGLGIQQREMILFRWFPRIIQTLIVVNGGLFLALIGYLLVQITS